MSQIAEVRAFPLAYPEPNDDGSTRHTTLVRVTTADGLVGWARRRPCGPRPRGRSRHRRDGPGAPAGWARPARHHGPLAALMRAHTWWCGDGDRPPSPSAPPRTWPSGISRRTDGRAAVLLLAGACASACASASALTPARPARRDGRRFWCHRRIGRHSGQFASASAARPAWQVDPARDLAFVAAVRAAVGPDVEIMVDLGYNVLRAHAGHPHDPRLSQPTTSAGSRTPCRAGTWDGHRQLRAAVTTPIATGEAPDVRAVPPAAHCAGAADVILVDAGRAEGVTGYWKIQELAASAGAWSTPTPGHGGAGPRPAPTSPPPPRAMPSSSSLPCFNPAARAGARAMRDREGGAGRPSPTGPGPA